MRMTKSNESKEKLVEIRNLKKHFPIDRKNILKAVDGLTFDIHKGGTFGLVGESGCGKSSDVGTVLGRYGETDGEVVFKGESAHNRKYKIDLKHLNQKMKLMF